MREPMAIRWIRALEKAMGLAVKGKYLKSIKYAKKVLEMNPKAAEAHYSIGTSYELLSYEEEDKGNYSQAEDYLKKAKISWDEAKKIDPDIHISYYDDNLSEEKMENVSCTRCNKLLETVDMSHGTTTIGTLPTLYDGVICKKCGKIECTNCKGTPIHKPCSWCKGEVSPAYQNLL